MPTVYREKGYRFVIYTNDHRPPHVHVQKVGSEARVGIDPIEVLENWGYHQREIKTILEIMARNQDTFLKAWNEYHAENGDDE
ncbi:MAG: DUF4160 domain-containing protein [Anaerolineae bacterium]|nr:DUF4160 domain-containing protein [Anaerolineae bacterium]